MSITTTAQTLIDGHRSVVMHFTGTHDGQGGQEKNTVKVDVSALSPPCSFVRIRKVQYSVSHGLLKVQWGDEAGPVDFLVLDGTDEVDFSKVGGARNGGGYSSTGDIVFTTDGFERGSAYSVTLEMIKSF